MNILIVEDEIKTLNHICIAIQKLFPNWTIVGNAKNGQEGVQIALSSHPDLIITDIKMPVMDGLEMIRQLIQKDCTSKFIILSGHSDFAFAREALKLGSVDYLLKPFTLNTFKHALESVELTILQEKEILASLPSSFSPQKLFTMILTLQDNAKELYQKEYSKKIDNSYHNFLLLIKSDHTFARDNISKLLDVVASFCSENHLPEAPHYHYRENQEFLFLFHFPVSVKSSCYFDLLKSKIERNILLPFAYYYSQIFQIKNIHLSLEHMRQQISWNLSFPESCVLTDTYISEQIYHPYFYKPEIEHQICKYISSKQYNHALQIFNEFCLSLKKRLYSHSDIRSAMFRLTEAILVTIRTENHSVYEQLDYLEIMNWTKTRLFLSSIQKIITNIFSALENFDQSLRTCSNPIVNRALNIISTDYAQNISLETVAERCNVTYEYLSSLFTKELGIKFTTCLTQYRISQAKKMLSHGTSKIYEVSLHCGYEDVHYFCKVFKKQVGMSPTEYIHHINH